MSFIINILLFIVILGIIVFVHEFGHFIWAKITGVYVYEFSIGMGPKIIGKKGKETEYNIRAIPIGGFCQLAGENLDEDDAKKVPKERRLQSKPAFQRFLIMVFGPLNNFILAVILLLLIAAIWGGTTLNPIITTVEKESAAEIVGLKQNDKIIKINNHKVTTSDDISLFLAVANPKKYNTIIVERNNKRITIKIKPKKIVENKKTTYRYGIGISQKKTHGFKNVFKYAFLKTKSIFKQMIVTVGYLFRGKVKLNQLSGPVGIYSIIGEQSKEGIANLIYITALLSINVGFINLLPLPAFDGGHILFIIIEKIKGSPVKPETENMIHTVGLFLLMALMVYITFNDILKLF